MAVELIKHLNNAGFSHIEATSALESAAIYIIADCFGQEMADRYEAAIHAFLNQEEQTKMAN
jgi:hypothetical protein